MSCIWKIFYIDYEPTHMELYINQLKSLVSQKRIPVKVRGDVSGLNVTIILPDFIESTTDDVLNLLIKIFNVLEITGKGLGVKMCQMQVFDKESRVLDRAFDGLSYTEEGIDTFFTHRIVTYSKHGVAMELDEDSKLKVTISPYPDEQGAVLHSFKKGIILLFYQLCLRDDRGFKNYQRVSELLTSIKKL